MGNGNGALVEGQKQYHCQSHITAGKKEMTAKIEDIQHKHWWMLFGSLTIEF